MVWEQDYLVINGKDTISRHTWPLPCATKQYWYSYMVQSDIMHSTLGYTAATHRKDIGVAMANIYLTTGYLEGVVLLQPSFL